MTPRWQTNRENRSSSGDSPYPELALLSGYPSSYFNATGAKGIPLCFVQYQTSQRAAMIHGWPGVTSRRNQATRSRHIQASRRGAEERARSTLLKALFCSVDGWFLGRLFGRWRHRRIFPPYRADDDQGASGRHGRSDFRKRAIAADVDDGVVLLAAIIWLRPPTAMRNATLPKCRYAPIELGKESKDSVANKGLHAFSKDQANPRPN